MGLDIKIEEHRREGSSKSRVAVSSVHCMTRFGAAISNLKMPMASHARLDTVSRNLEWTTFELHNLQRHCPAVRSLCRTRGCHGSGSPLTSPPALPPSSMRIHNLLLEDSTSQNIYQGSL